MIIKEKLSERAVVKKRRLGASVSSRREEEHQ